MNQSSYFLTPVLGINYTQSIYTPSFVDTYLARVEDVQCDENSCGIDGTFMYFLYRDDVDPALANHFRNHNLFDTEFVPAQGYVLFRFRIPDNEVETVVKPFLAGRYSQIDRTYVDKNFPAGNASFAGNRAILTKAESMRKYWEDKIGQPLPEGAEVWSKPTLTNEVYGYLPTISSPELSQ